MGKPIAGRNKSPFGIAGINVDAAVLPDGTQLTNVKISKQRSNHRFDLISTDGTTVYPFMQITGTDKNGAALLITDSNSTLASKLANGTFCISVVDSTSTVVGFAAKLELNKVILQDGTPVYLTSYAGQVDLTVYVTGVSLNQTTAAIRTGGTLQLTKTITPNNATNQSVQWTSSNTAVATVSASGLITAVANGTANIQVQTVDGSYTASCAVTVTTGVTGVTVAPSTVTLSLAGTKTSQLTPTVAPAAASNKAVTYTSSAPAVATVSSTGLVTGISAGSATITVTTVDGSFTATTAVTVTA